MNVLSNNRQLDPYVSRHLRFGAEISAKSGCPLFFVLENLEKQHPICSRLYYGRDSIL